MFKLSKSSKAGLTPRAENGFAWNWWAIERTDGVSIRAWAARSDDQHSETGDVRSLPDWSVVRRSPSPPAIERIGNAFPEVCEDAYGWPRPALMSRVDYTVWDPVLQSFRPRIVHGVENRMFRPGIAVRVWPTRVLWQGLALDWLTMLPVATCFAFAPTAVRLARRSLRREYQKCGGCGYERIGNAEEWTCPECGSLQHFVPPIGWTNRFSVLTFFKRPRIAIRLIFAIVFAMLAAVVGVYLAGFIGPM